jgi:hypothetical protein
MCSSGNGIGAGWKAFWASRSRTDESLPMEYSITGRWNSEATSRMNVDALGFQQSQMAELGHQERSVAGDSQSTNVY